MNEDDNSIFDIRIARVKKVNKTTHAIVADFTLKKPIDNAYRVYKRTQISLI
jgi:hypothetical protein